MLQPGRVRGREHQDEQPPEEKGVGGHCQGRVTTQYEHREYRVASEPRRRHEDQEVADQAGTLGPESIVEDDGDPHYREGHPHNAS